MKFISRLFFSSSHWQGSTLNDFWHPPLTPLETPPLWHLTPIIHTKSLWRSLLINDVSFIVPTNIKNIPNSTDKLLSTTDPMITIAPRQAVLSSTSQPGEGARARPRRMRGPNRSTLWSDRDRPNGKQQKHSETTPTEAPSFFHAPQIWTVACAGGLGWWSCSPPSRKCKNRFKIWKPFLQKTSKNKFVPIGCLN